MHWIDMTDTQLTLNHMPQIMSLLPTIKLYVQQQMPLFSTKWWDGCQWALQHTTGSNFNKSFKLGFCITTCSTITSFLKLGNVTMLLVSLSGFPTRTQRKHCYEWIITMTGKYINQRIHFPFTSLSLWLHALLLQTDTHTCVVLQGAHAMKTVSYSFDSLYTSEHIHIFTFLFLLFWSLFSSSSIFHFQTCFS